MAPKRKQVRQPKKTKKAAEPSAVWAEKVNRSGNKVRSQAFKPNARKPIIMQRTLQQVDGARYARRPWKIAREAGHFNGVHVQWADAYDPPSDWSDEEDLPIEAKLEDCGWRAGPVDRQLPPFLGKKPGPTDPSLKADSSTDRFLDTQLSFEFRKKLVEYTHAHCAQWRKEDPNWRSDSIEQSMVKYKKKFTIKAFDIWLACRLRLAHLKPEVHAYSLWNRHSSLFDVQVFQSLTYNQYQWINRHASFADVQVDDESESEEDEAEEDDGAAASEEEQSSDSAASADEDVIHSRAPTRDPHRKRRELTDLVCESFAKAWNPHQHLGLDEAVRAHKHWGTQRIRFKAAVHSGSLVDSLNDCETKYCMWFEERRWVRRDEDDDDPYAITSRLLRAANVLCDKTDEHDKPMSDANFCITMDRGYGLVEAQQALAERGVYSNAIMATNRSGLPRNYLRELAKDLEDCGQVQDAKGKWVKCPHDLDSPECRRYNFTALHKAGDSTGNGVSGADWELALWQDGQLIVSYSNFFSSLRCGLLHRGARARSFSAWVPEAIWHYNLQGRSATDGSDQLRKKLCIAERRIVRAGVKGITFVLDLAITNASTMWCFMNRQTVRNRCEFESKFNKVRAVQRTSINMCSYPLPLVLAGEVLSAVGGARAHLQPSTAVPQASFVVHCSESGQQLS